jgi:3-methylcrotonyl-CoA carboxylase alpha subunit
MLINYEHEENIYNVSVVRRKDHYFITYDNTEYKVEAEEIQPGYLKIKLGDRIIKCVITRGEDKKFVFVDGDVFKVKNIELTGAKKTKKINGENSLNSPISGKIVSIKVNTGDNVKKGDVLMVIEAMKMEYLIRAPYNGKINNVKFKENDQIEIGQNTFDIVKK